MTAAISSLVHTQETGVRLDYPESYRAYLIERDRTEMDATELAYLEFSLRTERDYLSKLTNCRSASWFARNIHTNEVTLLNNSCRLRWCPLCARARQYQIRISTEKWVAGLVKPKFLTLTVKHTDQPLSDQINFLYKSFIKLRKTPFFSSRIRAGCWFFQIKRSKTTLQWHPHLHCILDSEYIERITISKRWEVITGDSMVIDIRAIKNLIKTADYVARYAAKPAHLKDLSTEDAAEVIASLHGRKLCGTWGSGIHLKFRPQCTTTKADWQYVGSWNTVISKIYTSHTARAIMKAWQTKSTLDPKHTFVTHISASDFELGMRTLAEKWDLEPYLSFMQPP